MSDQSGHGHGQLLHLVFGGELADLQKAEFRDLDKLDIELKLLKSSLDEDIGPARSAVALEAKKGTA